MPGETNRIRVIWLTSLAFGIVLVPIALWSYTAHIDVLWGGARQIWAQPGAYLCLIVVFFLYVIAPARFPGLLRRLGRLEDRVFETISKGP